MQRNAHSGSSGHLVSFLCVTPTARQSPHFRSINVPHTRLPLVTLRRPYPLPHLCPSLHSQRLPPSLTRAHIPPHAPTPFPLPFSAVHPPSRTNAPTAPLFPDKTTPAPHATPPKKTTTHTRVAPRARTNMLARSILTATLALALAASAAAEITMTSTVRVLLSFGEADTVVTAVADGSEQEVTVSESMLYTVGAVTSVPAANGQTNYSIPLTMETGVGVDDLTVTIGGETATASVIVAGMVIKQDGQIVSGDNYPGVTVGIEGTTTFQVEAIGTDGQVFDPSSATVTPSAMSGTYMLQYDAEASSLSSTEFILAIAQYRTSADGFKLNYDIPSLELNGESFETNLKVMQTPTTAPCVAVGGTYTSSNGVVLVDMYNVVADEGASISVAGSPAGALNSDESSFSMPLQQIAFDFATEGEATITCGDIEAFVLNPPVIIDVSATSEPLAKDNVFVVDEVDNKDRLTARISLLTSSPETLTVAQADPIVVAFCSYCGVPRGADCNIVEVTAGSAVLTMVANVESGEGEGVERTVKSKVDSCEYAQEVNVNCPDLVYLQSTVKAVGAPTTAAAAGLATWTIVLIAGVGAFALILLIMLGLLAVYRRSAEQSESDYSSSGPLGVPDPSDLLYEQSIVRDIYGRGDFPEGGPSADVAEQREREAALREEFPRPPSSSGVSRGSATDDASSTYSV